jgi:hypothetical protein
MIFPFRLFGRDAHKIATREDVEKLRDAVKELRAATDSLAKAVERKLGGHAETDRSSDWPIGTRAASDAGL